MSKIDKLLNSAKEHLDSNENVLAYVMGAHEAKIMGKDSVRNGIFIATDIRLVFFSSKMFKGYDMEVFPYSNISSIEMGKSLMGHTISFFASGNKVSMKWINGDVSSFMNIVKPKIDKKANPSPATNNSMPDIADQIRKLSDLKNEGILSEEEFQAKKVQLLSQM